MRSFSQLQLPHLGSGFKLQNWVMVRPGPSGDLLCSLLSLGVGFWAVGHQAGGCVGRPDPSWELGGGWLWNYHLQLNVGGRGWGVGGSQRARSDLTPAHNYQMIYLLGIIFILIFYLVPNKMREGPGGRGKGAARCCWGTRVHGPSLILSLSLGFTWPSWEDVQLLWVKVKALLKAPEILHCS